MLIEFKVANYRSIKDEITLSFVAERAPRHTNNLIDCSDYRLLKSIAIFGANASGKSNIVKALKAMRDFVVQSATRYNEGDPILTAEPYLLDPDTKHAPTRFEITVKLSQGIYRYGFSISKTRVVEEFLFSSAKLHGKETQLFHRAYQESIKGYSLVYQGANKERFNLIFEALRDNALVLSVGTQFQFVEFLYVYNFFSSVLQIHDMSSRTTHLLRSAERMSEENVRFQEELAHLIRDADVGIEAFRVDKTVRDYDQTDIFDEDRADDLLVSDRLPVVIKVTDRKVKTIHRDRAGSVTEFDLEKQESHGTQRLFGLGSLFISALEQGQCLVIDEFDASLHPRLTRALVELFHSPYANKTGAQMLFTTHDIALFDGELFRRDQLVLVEKYSTGTEIYSLADLDKPPRNTERFMNNYLGGIYGGTPHLGLTFSLNEFVGTEE